MTVSDPPSYESISSADADADKLPPYSNSIHLYTLCRRKLEYTAPNVPTRKGTRGWHFYWLVLYGTALTIYQPTRAEVNAHLQRETAISATRLKEHNRTMLARKTNNSPSPSTPPSAERPPSVLYPHPNESVSSAHSSPRPSTTTPPHSSSPSPSPSPSPLSSPVHKWPLDAHECRVTTSEPQPPPPPLVIGGKPHPGNQARPDARTHKLVKQYTMNGATCVRAYDYIRRYFVLRIRADGQEFMVQLNSYPETIEWLAAFSVAACLSLDLDERPMVEPPAYPRRRRHPADSSTDRWLENSNPHRPEISDSSEAAHPFLPTRSSMICINF